MDEELKQEEQDQEQENTPNLEEENEKLKDEIAQVRADYYNFRQRTIKERQDTRKRAQEDVISAILPVLDNLDRALEAAQSEDAASILKGVEMVQRQFMSVLEGLGVTAIKAEGEVFDPMLHDASGTEEVDDPELDGKVITQRLKGYKMNDRVLRPAQVTVGKH